MKIIILSSILVPFVPKLRKNKMNDDSGKKRMKDFQAPRYLVPIIVGMSVICIFLFIMKYYFGGI